MIDDENLPQFAAELRRHGIDAEVKSPCGPKGVQIGLQIGRSFYPLWELNLEENAAALASFDFESIRARRTAGWTIAIPS
jgi:hypothetical protein